MYKGDFKSKLRVNLSNIPGFRTKRRIVVIESDDWGSIRTKDSSAWQKMKDYGFNVDKKHYDTVDTLESNEDLEILFETLRSIKDSNGRSLTITPMALMGNPDFQKIEAEQFKQYFFQPLAETLNDYPGSTYILNLWRQGDEEGIFQLALHGREHLNVRRYLKMIQPEDGVLHEAFKVKSFGGEYFNNESLPNYMGALYPCSIDEIDELKDQVLEAGKLFRDTLNRPPTSFIAPNREEPKELEESLSKIGVKYLTRSKIRLYPHGDGNFSKEYNWLGKTNDYGQTIIVRNCFFEPVTWGAHSYIKDWVKNCLKEIEIAFFWNKPAVISSHRVNYVGSIRPDMRAKGLESLKALINGVKKRWPDVEFMSTMELGEYIKSQK